MSNSTSSTEGVKHTPGPWEWDYGVSVRAGDRLVALVYSTGALVDGESNLGENARLIAAAPELLEACRYAVKAGAIHGLALRPVLLAIAKATVAQP
jgi:hypothetical protein